VRVERYIPHTMLFPRCQVVIDHGGRGTMMNAIRHGIPQLMLPQGADQFANAEICEREGIARALMPDAVTPDAVRSAVRALIDDEAMRTRIRSLNEEMDRLHPVAHGVALLERLARERTAIARPS
jgi:UDP:flavonoid glycosyltransferase YjiC (YdhE family)